jgi:hypothetical protein
MINRYKTVDAAWQDLARSRSVIDHTNFPDRFAACPLAVVGTVTISNLSVIMP